MPNVFCVGIAVLDYIFSVGAMPDQGHKVGASSLRTGHGGPATTAAVAIAKLGGNARWMGPVGSDHAGGELIAELRRHGIDTTHAMRVSNCLSPTSAVILEPDGERTIVNYTDPDLTHQAPEPIDLGGCDAVLTDVRWPVAAVPVLRAARSAGLPSVVDFDHQVGDLDGELLDAASHLAFSAQALRQRTGVGALGEALLTLAQNTHAHLLVTDGADGVTWLEGPEIKHLPAFPVDAVDTLGAGDLFHGALILAIARGHDLAAAIRYAAAAAAIKCSRPGGRAGFPSHAEVETFLGEHAS
ncbi:MAG: PfkB family carbohydrate kinase [Geminicoccaceae bacterium]